MIVENYRKDYLGEFVIVESRWSGGRKQQSREWIPNQIENHHISGRATCIASSIDQHLFDYRILQRHRGGLLGSKKLQTYGTGEIAKEMRLDFIVETARDKLDELESKDYHNQSVIYTTPRHCLEHPGKFYLIPYGPKLVKPAVLPYLAAFDGHKEVFMIGYNIDMPVENKTQVEQIQSVFECYSGTKFYIIGESHRVQSSWQEISNVSLMGVRDFITYCDV